MIEQLEQLFNEPPEWDSQKRYILQNINVYFEGKDKCSLNIKYKVDIRQSLGKILQDER